MATETTYGTGRRKIATARVFIKPGSGQITVNKKLLDDYFRRPTSRMIVRQALEATVSTSTSPCAAAARTARPARFATVYRVHSSPMTK